MLNQFKEILKHPLLAGADIRFNYSLDEDELRQAELLKCFGFEAVDPDGELTDVTSESACWFYNQGRQLFATLKYNGIRLYQINSFDDFTNLIGLTPKGTDLRVIVSSEDILHELFALTEEMVKRIPLVNLEELGTAIDEEKNSITITAKFKSDNEVHPITKEITSIFYNPETNTFEYLSHITDRFGARANTELNLRLITILSKLYYLEQRLSETDLPF